MSDQQAAPKFDPGPQRTLQSPGLKNVWKNQFYPFASPLLVKGLNLPLSSLRSSSGNFFGPLFHMSSNFGQNRHILSPLQPSCGNKRLNIFYTCENGFQPWKGEWGERGDFSEGRASCLGSLGGPRGLGESLSGDFSMKSLRGFPLEPHSPVSPLSWDGGSTGTPRKI